MSDDNRVWKHCPCSIPCSWLNDLLTNYLIAGSSNLPPKHILVMLIKKDSLSQHGSPRYLQGRDPFEIIVSALYVTLKAGRIHTSCSLGAKL